MNLRLTEAETEALRRKAEQEGRSMQEVARAAIAAYVSDRPRRLQAAIARDLALSEKTVKAHVSAILGKLDVADRTQAALYAVHHNLAAD